MATYLITGASRGIGLELTKQLLELPACQVSKIFTLARNIDSDHLEQLVQKHPGRVFPISASVNVSASIEKAAEAVKAKLEGQGLDVLINNAAIISHSEQGVKSMKTDELAQVFDVNVVGTQRVTAAFMPLLEQGTQKKIINISSAMGSCDLAKHFASVPIDAYIISKAALNMLTLRYAHQYADAGFTFFAVSPGWLKTDMGSQEADISVEVGVAEVKRIILESGKEQNGKFLDIKVPKTDQMTWEYNGGELPW